MIEKSIIIKLNRKKACPFFYALHFSFVIDASESNTFSLINNFSIFKSAVGPGMVSYTSMINLPTCYYPFYVYIE